MYTFNYLSNNYQYSLNVCIFVQNKGDYTKWTKINIYWEGRWLRLVK
jgi:hypothetical protein